MGVAGGEVPEGVGHLISGLCGFKVFAGAAVGLANALDAKTERRRRRDGFAPHHVARLGDALQSVLLVGGRVRVDLDHFVVHVTPQLGFLLRLGQLVLQVRAHPYLAVHHARRREITQ